MSTLEALGEQMVTGVNPYAVSSRIKFKVMCSREQVLWVPQGTCVGLLGLASGGTGGTSAVAYFPWLSSNLALEHMAKSEHAARCIANVAMSTIREHDFQRACGAASNSLAFFAEVAANNAGC